MQTFTTCMKCQIDDGIPNFSSNSVARIPDDGVIYSTCNKGHRTVTIIQEMKFEILSDMAIKAIVDGYYRDAIASFMGALERLYEFFIEATFRKHGIDKAAFSAANKALTNLSERQLGAFVAVFLLESGKSPMLLPQKMTKLRNDVIHKGKFPDRAETVQFCQNALDCAMEVLYLLKSEPFRETVNSIVDERIMERHKSATDIGINISTCSISTILSLTRLNWEGDIEDALTQRETRPVII